MPAPRLRLLPAALLGACSLLFLQACGEDDPFADRDRPAAEAAQHGASAVNRALRSTVAITVGGTEPAKTGTGTMIAEGTVITDRRLVTDASGAARASVSVRDAEGNERSGIVDGTDALSGLAAIRVRGLESVPALPAGKEPAFAGALSAVGFVSARRPAMKPGAVLSAGRTVRRDGVAEVGLFETSANLGAQGAGGALVDDAGKGVGITTRVLAPMLPGAVVALPIRSARRIATALRQDGRVRRAYLGIESLAVTPSRAEELGLKTASGLILRATAPGSPADFAAFREPTGMREVGGRQIPTGGDVLVEASGTKLAEPEDLDAVLAKVKPGRELQVRVIRGNRSVVVAVRAGER